MTWPRAARAAFVSLVLLSCLTAQVQVWTADDPDRVLHAVAAAAYTLPLLWARRWPLGVALVVTAVAFVDHWLGGHGGQAWFSLLAAVYALGRYAGPRSAVLGAAAVAAGVLSVDLPRLHEGSPIDEVVPGWLMLAAVGGLGRWIGSWHQRAERDADRAARAAVAHERARIARELHDLVAHSMAVTVLHAQAAQRVLESDPAQAASSLASIEGLTRQGLSELRRLLEILDDRTEASPLDPPPTLARVDELVAQVRAAGLAVTLTVEGGCESLPAGLDLSAYRIVQESLTNALKHAGPGASVDLHLTYRADAIEILVANDCTDDVSAPGTGRGLIGIRERVGLYGGHLEAGHRREGFVVRATLPLGPALS